MNKRTEQKWEEKNKRGIKLLKETFLKYKEYILGKTSNDPDLLAYLLYELEISEENFYNRLDNYMGQNISFYAKAVDVIEFYEKQKGTDAEAAEKV